MAGLMLGFASTAQDTKPSEDHRKKEHVSKHMDKWADELSMTAEQKAEMEKLNAGLREKKMSIKANTALNEEQKKAEFKALHQARKEGMKNILTAEQMAQLKAKKQEQREKHKASREEFKKELNLSDDQKAKIAVLNEQMKEKRTAIKANASLSEDQKKEQFKALHTERKTQMKAILTPEQQKLMKEKKGDHKKHKKDHPKKSNK